jgi:hypothetical protein
MFPKKKDYKTRWPDFSQLAARSGDNWQLKKKTTRGVVTIGSSKRRRRDSTRKAFEIFEFLFSCA